FSSKAAAAHGHIHERAFARSRFRRKGYRKGYFHAIVLAPVLFHAKIANAPLEKAETITAQLTLERINIKHAEQPLAQSDSGNPPHKVAGAVGTLQIRHSIS